jgi:hypothetical protein
MSSEDRNDEKTKADRNEKKRKRYAEDPEYREQIIANARAYRSRNREQVNHKARERRKANPELRQQGRDEARVRHWRSKCKVDMTIPAYNRMLVRQRGVCKICGKKHPKKALCVDHRHSTGWIRGLLCNKCNFGLGSFDDNPLRMLRAAGYIVVALAQESLSRLIRRAGSFWRRTAAKLRVCLGPIFGRTPPPPSSG